MDRGAGLAWIGLAGALVAVVLALRDLKGRGVYAAIALILSGVTVGGFLWQQNQLSKDTRATSQPMWRNRPRRSWPI